MKRRAFTLIELVLATAACAVLLTAVYSVFSKAVHLRDGTTARTREARVRAHAAGVLRNDLRNAIVSGGTLAGMVQGAQQSPNGGFPGYLTFVTTTTPDVDDAPDPDLQQVEYYIVADASAADQKAGILVRTYNRIILGTTSSAPTEEQLLPGVESMTVTFFDGTSWQTSWQYSTKASTTASPTTTTSSTTTSNNTTLPQAVRVSIQPARGTSDTQTPAPIEILVPWPTAAATGPLAAPLSTTSTTTTTP